jgi:prepilin-type N-terminal cleavage/methylation domain-containing protein/prepilin-type processing-associated H-X9-DG protein
MQQPLRISSSSTHFVNSTLPGKRLSVGFTLLELLMVVAIIGVLAGILIPSVFAAKRKAGAAVCVNQLKQLQLCWLIYAGDHQDAVPANDAASDSGVWRSAADSWIGRSSAVYDLDTSNIEGGLFYRLNYNRVTKLYQCPADRSKVTGSNGARGSQRRTRSYSANGAWAGRTNEAQRVLYRLGEASQPASLFVFLDEEENSIDDAQFLVWPEPDNRWVNLPSDRHGKAGVFSFADGHVEVWKWRWRKTFVGRTSYWKAAENAADLSDLRRLQEAVPRMVVSTNL